MSFIIREKTDRKDPFYYSDSGWTQVPTEATPISARKEALEMRDSFYKEEDWDGEIRYEVVESPQTKRGEAA